MLLKYMKELNLKYYSSNLLYSPKWIVLGVNNYCNLSCKMCDVGLKEKDSNFVKNLTLSPEKEMPWEVIKKIIDEISLYFPKTTIAYAFTEPLMYSHLIKSINYAHSKGLNTILTTNGLGLPLKIDDLVSTGLKEIHISLDGLEDIHNKIRGNKSSFRDILESIKLLQNYKNKPKIGLISTITEWNIFHLKEFVDFFKNLGIDEIGFMHTQFIDSKMAEIHNTIWSDKYPTSKSSLSVLDINNFNMELLLEQIRLIKSEEYPFNVYFAPELDTKVGLNEYYFNSEKFIGKRCSSAFNSMMVKTDGTVIPAHGRCFNLTIGNVHDNTLKEIWNSSVVQEFRKDLLSSGGLFPSCSRCCSGI